jgi:hypothetical protein
VVQIWPGLIVCKQVTACPGHIWTTLYFFLSASTLKSHSRVFLSYAAVFVSWLRGNRCLVKWKSRTAVVITSESTCYAVRPFFLPLVTAAVTGCRGGCGFVRRARRGDRRNAIYWHMHSEVQTLTKHVIASLLNKLYGLTQTMPESVVPVLRLRSNCAVLCVCVCTGTFKYWHTAFRPHSVYYCHNRQLMLQYV